MPERKNFLDFLNECGGIVEGYGLKDGQLMPETYGELLIFMTERLHIEGEVSAELLTDWLMREGVDPVSCNPDTDTSHAEVVILIGELQDPDTYVAQLPIGPGGTVPLPPSEIVRQLIELEAAS